MYAVIETGGKQYRVSPGQTIQVEKLPGEAGQELELTRILVVTRDTGEVLTGNDLGNASVKAQIVGQGRGEKITVFKFKRKKQYKRTIGHRQFLTELKVTDIVA